MKFEEESGLAFVERLVPALPASFPEHGEVINLFDQTKSVLFVMQGLTEVVDVRVISDVFSISVAEMVPSQEDVDFFNTIEVGGVVYLVTNSQAVWYPTESCSIRHLPGDLERQLELLKESFLVLREWFEDRR